MSTTSTTVHLTKSMPAFLLPAPLRQPPHAARPPRRCVTTTRRPRHHHHAAPALAPRCRALRITCASASPCPSTGAPNNPPVPLDEPHPLQPSRVQRILQHARTPVGRRTALLLAIIALAGLACLPASPFNVLQYLSPLLHSLTSYAARVGPLRAMLLLGILNFCTVLLCFPANMGLMITAGAILPPLYAFAALFVSKLLAACSAFVLTRTFFQARAHAWLIDHPRFDTMLKQSGVMTSGWKFVVVMRLSPFPGFMLNYLLSLTGISFRQYFFGSLVGIIPSIANLVLIGNAARDVGLGVLSGSVLAGWAGWLPLFVKLLCAASMITVSVYVTRAMLAAFRNAEGVVE